MANLSNPDATAVIDTVVTDRRTLGQIVVCEGCCCGRTDRGHPEVPVDWLKSEWKRRQLGKHVHLSISRCLGPCDVSNVALVFAGDATVWLGRLRERQTYQTLLDWAAACAADGGLPPLPASLDAFRLNRFADR